jgi:hypothetical protein
VPAVYVLSDSYMVRVDDNVYALRRTRPGKPPAEINPERSHQQNVRELVLDLAEGERERPARDGGDRFGNAVGARRLGMIVDHGCALDDENEPEMVHFAVVRELDDVPEEHRDAIRSYDQKRTFYLPSSDVLLDEHYADFRFITTVRRELVDVYERVCSLSDEGRLALKGQLVRFWARKRLPDGWWDWPDEHEERPRT